MICSIIREVLLEIKKTILSKNFFDHKTSRIKGKFRQSSSKLTSFILSAGQNLMGIPLPIPSVLHFYKCKVFDSCLKQSQHGGKAAMKI